MNTEDSTSAGREEVELATERQSAKDLWLDCLKPDPKPRCAGVLEVVEVELHFARLKEVKREGILGLSVDVPTLDDGLSVDCEPNPVVTQDMHAEIPRRKAHRGGRGDAKPAGAEVGQRDFRRADRILKAAAAEIEVDF